MLCIKLVKRFSEYTKISQFFSCSYMVHYVFEAMFQLGLTLPSSGSSCCVMSLLIEEGEPWPVLAYVVIVDTCRPMILLD